MGVDAVKIGMLFDEPTIDAVAEALELVGEAPVVVDPVMVAESGAVLLKPEAKRALIERILPRATVVTPNLAEARELTGLAARPRPRTSPARSSISDPAAVVVTGRPHRGRRRPLLRRRAARADRRARATPDGASHGSGCTHSSALAARLALGDTPLEAARAAREIASEAVAKGLRDLGSGAGPVDVLGIVKPAPERTRQA